jgi:DNA end-binding protein Ku
MRSIWKGAINFGLVNIPVAVYPATREDKVSFKQLRKKDLSPIRYKKVAEADDQEVPAAEIVKGYEYEKGKWVVLEEKDFEAVEIASTHAIEITDFIVLEEINPKFFTKPYFLEAQKGGEKAYALLHRALLETGKVGIAKVAIRSREYLAAVRVDGLFLMLELMHFAQEVLQPDGLKAPFNAELNPKEIAMAKQLIDSLSGAWEPEKYADTYQDAIREVIEQKIQHQPAKSKTPQPVVAGPTIDLLAILQQSIAEGTEKRKKAGARGTRPKTTAALVTRKRGSGVTTS